ncbi:MAG: hypothetical protein AB3P11_03425 [Wolbachia pipientis]
MITELMNGFLDYSPEQAEAFLQLLSIEKQWKTQYHKEGELKPENIKTKADLFKFIQAIGQSQWFKGHDRLRYEVDISKDLKKDEYFKLFKSIGLIDKVSYNSDEAGGPPNFSVVLGAYQLGVETRVNTLIEDYKNGIRPTEDIIIGLGCNRKLDSTIESITNDLRDSDPNKKPTEMDMINFVIEEAIEENQLEGIKYEPVSTSSEAKTRADESCVKTSDTAVSLKGYLENYLLNKSIDDPIKLVVYSHQPFIERQKVDMESRLPKNYKVYCVGNEITSEDFKKSPTIVVLCLAEIARYINTKFIEKHQYIEGDLSEEQRQEIDLLTRDNTKENKVGTSIQELSVEHPRSYRVR